MVSVKVNITLPKRDFASRKWLEAMASKQRSVVLPKLRAVFKKTIYGWSEAKQPDFGWVQTRNNNSMTLAMYPKGPNAELWALVSRGAPAHPIPARTGGLLRFKKGYRSATRPGTLMSRRAYRSNPVWTARVVAHPGFEPRNFPAMITQEFANIFTKDMQDALNKVARS
ncbi:MAG: hypothetical protein IPI97_14845 [Nitrosomonas sp.]|nr:hypothetical protein [Nitrosomonas sp.]